MLLFRKSQIYQKILIKPQNKSRIHGDRTNDNKLDYEKPQNETAGQEIEIN